MKLLVVGFLLVSAACGPKGAAPSDRPMPSQGEILLNVTNHYSLPAEIYALGEGVRQRMGTVHPGMSSSFVLPSAMVGKGNVEFSAEITGELPVRTGSLQLVPGDVVEFEIATHLMGSTARVRPP
jgi:hypothetical protein